MHLIAAIAAAWQLAAIYQCGDGSGTPYFTDQPCPHGRVITGRPMSVIAPAPLSAEERRRLAALASGTQRRGRAKRGRAEEYDAVRSHSGREDECAAARAALSALRDERRRGYSVRRANELETREQALKRARRRAC